MKFKYDLTAIMQIAMPAMLTNLATPIGGSFVLKTMAGFGDSAVAGAAILGRLSPFVFVLIYALSGAVGPVIGQNAGAKRYDRVQKIMLESLLVIVMYVLLVWLVLFFSRGWIIELFDAKDDSAYLINLFCQWLAGAFIFNGMLFIANACFNNLNRALWSTLFNFGRVLLGTIPMVYFGANWFGAGGVIAGELAGGVLFGGFAYVAVLAHINTLKRRQPAYSSDDR
jgi:Na+-driven multidrug efflux pump